MTQQGSLFLLMLIALALLPCGCRPPSAGEEVVAGCALHGLVIDNKTRQPVFDAAILVEGTKLGAMSDSLGHFCVPTVPNGTYTLRISKPGYMSKHLKGVVAPRDSTLVLLAKLKVSQQDIP